MPIIQIETQIAWMRRRLAAAHRVRSATAALTTPVPKSTLAELDNDLAMMRAIIAELEALRTRQLQAALGE